MLRTPVVNPLIQHCRISARVVRTSPGSTAPGLRRYLSIGGANDSSTNRPVKPRSRIRRALNIGLFGFAFASLGFFVAVSPAVPNLLAVTRAADIAPQAYTPENDEAAAVDARINSHPLVAELRRRPEMVESRPHMKFPEVFRKQNLTGGTLLGPGRLTVPPVMWSEEGGKSLVTVMHLGTDMCGHPGIVHGGLLATLLDEGLARCCFDALPSKVAVTAKLEVNYRKPTPAGAYVVLRAETKKVEGRKAWVEGRIETLVDESRGEKPVVLVEASGLFISPKTGISMLLSKFR